MQKTSLIRHISKQAAFTMIELLIVIAILGILAVAVLAAINPIEQINRGRDTGSRSDSEQLLSAIDRFYAYKGYYPWVTNPNDESALGGVGGELHGVANDTTIVYGGGSIPAWPDNGTPDPCYVLDKIAEGDGANCVGTNELKRSFVTKVTRPDYNHLYVYYDGNPGSSLYVCFKPKSGAMQEDARSRCVDDSGSGLPADLQGVAGHVCADGEEFICLP